MFKKFIAASAALVLSAGTAVPALAIGPELNNCWGTVVSQRASYYHDLGKHSSSQSEPRIGVGRLAHDVFNLTVGEVGSLLGSLDDVVGQDPAGVTNCP